MKYILTALLASFIFFTGWFVREFQAETEVIEAIREAGDDLTNETSDAQLENRKLASDYLKYFVLGRAEAASSFLQKTKRDGADSAKIDANNIIEGFRIDYESGLDFAPFQTLATEVHDRITKLQSSKAEHSTK